MQYEEIAALFPDFLDDKLPALQRKQVIEALDRSEELQKALSSLVELRQSQSAWNDEEIPSWHRTAFLARVQHKSTNWMNWFSMATSIAAICLVVFRVQVVSNNEGYQISFGEQTDKVSFRRQASNYLDDLQAEQLAYIDHRFLEFENQQLQQNQQILTTALDYNRNERRQDLNQLTSFLLQQRSTDLVQSQTRYNTLFDSQTEDRKAIKSLYASINDTNNDTNNF